MHNSKDLLDSTQASLRASSTNTVTEAGPTVSDAPISDKQQEAVIGAVNQIFAEFELVYHNQYTKAFPTLEKLRFAKKLWFTHLCFYPADQIVLAAREAVQNSEYLPSIRGVVKYIVQDTDCFGLPSVRSAYMEACQAPSPKATYPWRHLAVYHAGKSSGWYFLSNNTEQKTFPIFQQHYQKFCQQVRQGFKLVEPNIEKLPDSIGSALSQDEQLEYIKALQNTLKF